MTTDLHPLVGRLLPLLRRFAVGEYGIALGGAHAKGVADAESDLDLYVFAQAILPDDERSRLCRESTVDGAGVVSWSMPGPFLQAGTDFAIGPLRVECWLRNTDYIAGIVAECQEGIVKHDLVTWTVMGYFNHCTLSDLDKMLPVEDPYGILARWKGTVSSYPPRLQEAIVSRHLRAARFWPDNFHYISAVERGDLIYVAGIVQQVVDNLIQVVFALNRAYFPGEKKLGVTLEHLARTPEHFAERVEGLLWPGAAGDREHLQAQRQELRALVQEVASLAGVA